MSLRRVPAIAAAVASLGGCVHHASTQSRQARIERGIAEDERRAALLRAETLKLKRRMEVQQQCIAYTQCKSHESLVVSFVAKHLAECNVAAANWYACDARNAKQATEDTLLGCFLGLGAAAVTGGAAAPWALVGCGGGAVVGDQAATGICTKTSRPLACGTRQAEFLTTALVEAGLTQAPRCLPKEPEGCAELRSLPSFSR